MLPNLGRISLTPVGGFYEIKKRDEYTRDAINKNTLMHVNEKPPVHLMTFRVELPALKPDGSSDYMYFSPEVFWQMIKNSSTVENHPEVTVWYEDWWALCNTYNPEHDNIPDWAHGLQRCSKYKRGVRNLKRQAEIEMERNLQRRNREDAVKRQRLELEQQQAMSKEDETRHRQAIYARAQNDAYERVRSHPDSMAAHAHALAQRARAQDNTPPKVDVPVAIPIPYYDEGYPPHEAFTDGRGITYSDGTFVSHDDDNTRRPMFTDGSGITYSDGTFVSHDDDNTRRKTWTDGSGTRYSDGTFVSHDDANVPVRRPMWTDSDGIRYSDGSYVPFDDMDAPPQFQSL